MCAVAHRAGRLWHKHCRPCGNCAIHRCHPWCAPGSAAVADIRQPRRTADNRRHRVPSPGPTPSAPMRVHEPCGCRCHAVTAETDDRHCEISIAEPAAFHKRSPSLQAQLRAYQSCTLTEAGSGVYATLLCALPQNPCLHAPTVSKRVASGHSEMLERMARLRRVEM